MVGMGRSADASGKRRLHVGSAILLAVVGLVGSAAFAANTTVAIICLTSATMGSLAALSLFWALPSAFLGGFAAASGLALINSVGNLAGFVSPYFVGLIKDATQSTDLALYLITVAVAGAGVLLLYVSPSVDR
jgi:cyanate permease